MMKYHVRLTSKLTYPGNQQEASNVFSFGSEVSVMQWPDLGKGQMTESVLNYLRKLE